MALPTSGPLAMSQVNSELALVSTTQLSFSQTVFRKLAGVLSGNISMSNLRGKSNRKVISLIISSATGAYNAYNEAVATGNYVAGSTDITVTVNSGVRVVGGDYQNLATSMTIGGFTSGDTVILINNGSIIGYGGQGGNSQYLGGTSGGAGGTALLISFATTIYNNGTIAGGGGGGQGGANNYRNNNKDQYYYIDGGGGGGGGAGATYVGYLVGYPGGPYLGGRGGTGTTGVTGPTFNDGPPAGDPDYIPGNGQNGEVGSALYYTGGAGGTVTASGGTSTYNQGSAGNSGTVGGAGGGLGENGITTTDFGGSAGGSAGYYISGNSYATWATIGTRLGLSG